MAQAAKTTEAVRLPQSGFAFYDYLKSRGSLARFNSDSIRRKAFPPEIQQIINYSHPALKNGRPLNKVMIVLVGQTGAGKSSTINYLFNDEICTVNSSSSETRFVTEYGKELCVTAESPPVIGFLSFVDLPGALDVDHSKEALNLATITKFRNENPDLSPRKGLMNMSTIVREQVYPNLVIMSIKSNDNRMKGPNSNLRKCLQELERYGFLDSQHTNLMIVVTHSMDINKKNYAARIKETTEIIQDAVLKVLRLRDVKVVFVENKPDDYDMDKDEGCDFYKLPDGQLSHYNLIKAMETHFENNNDVLGKLLCGWYFADNCPEKLNKANVLQSIEYTQLTEKEREKALQHLMSMNIQFYVEEAPAPPAFDFQYLGQGYCAKSETVNGLTVYPEDVTTNVKLLDALYSIPQSFTVTEVNGDSCYPLTYATEEMYEKVNMQKYGLEDDVKLAVHVESTGRWIDNNSPARDSVISVIYEKRLLSISIQNPETQIKSQVMEAINLLPPKYNEANAQAFHEFFNKWGSHFISKVWIGGSIKVDCTVNTSENGQEVISDICTTVNAAFSRLASSGHSQSAEHSPGFQRYRLSINGGDPTSVEKLSELTQVRFSDWEQSLKRNPVELRYSLQLCPYYILTKGLRKTNLMEATNQYLDGTIPEYLPIRRPTLSTNDRSSDIAAELQHPRTPSQIKRDVKTRSQTDKEGPASNLEIIPAEHPHASNDVGTSRITRNQVAENMVKNARLQAGRNQTSCFPPCAQVNTSNGLISISQLKPGAKVLTAIRESNCKTGLLTQTEFCTYLHYDAEQIEEFLVLHLGNCRSLTISKSHLLFINSQDGIQAIQAKGLKPGDELLCNYNQSGTHLEPVKIDKISTEVIQGVYSPLTKDGTLLVQGVFVSCYAHVHSHTVAHISMTPLRLWYNFQNSVRTIISSGLETISHLIIYSANPKSHSLIQSQRHSGIHKYAEILMAVRDKLPFQMFKD